MSAFACGPYHGSELGIGWNRAIEAARDCDTWVLCEEQLCEANIRNFLREQGHPPGLTFCFVPRRKWEIMLGRVPGLFYLSYNLWQRRAYRMAQALHCQHRFDLVHQVNFVGYREPGYLWKLGVPFIWGPVGGTQNFPWRFLGCAGVIDAVYESLRTLANKVQLRFRRRVHLAARAAAEVFASNTSIRDDMRRALGRQPKVQLDVGYRPSQVPVKVHKTGAGLHVLWSGTLCARKALPLLIDALPRLPPDVPCEVHVLGNGSYRARWERRARRQGVAHRIRWLGHLPHDEALRQFAWADVFVFTSLRDTSGTVMVEALAAGVPVVCLDHQGARDVVTPDCGIKIPVTSRRDVVRRLAEILQRLAADPALCQRLAAGARARAAEFEWSRLGEQMGAVYQRVLADPSRTLDVAPRHKFLAHVTEPEAAIPAT
jgi:glycosyltransferase involved in cell wall biosynthesis